LAPRDPDLQANLKFVRDQIQGPTFTPNRVMRSVSALTVNEWTVLVAITLWIWLLTVTLIQLRPALRPTLRMFSRFAGIATIGFGICLWTAWSQNSAQTAIVIVSDAMVHNGPLEESPKAFIVHDGA